MPEGVGLLGGGGIGEKQTSVNSTINKIYFQNTCAGGVRRQAIIRNL